MNAEFNWWLLIVGLVLGAALTWLVMAETVRRDIDVTEREQRSEAAWIAALLGGAGRAISADRVEEILRLHREYLAAPPPDEPADLDVDVDRQGPADGTQRPRPGRPTSPPGARLAGGRRIRARAGVT
jgi:hypothetical protein